MAAETLLRIARAAQMPVTAWLANHYAVCDQWFASLGSQTYANRAFTLCAAPNVSPDGKYSFVDAFNPLSGWYDKDVLGIDLGITMLMAENQRTGLIWKTFMKNMEAQTAMQRAGFKPV